MVKLFIGLGLLLVFGGLAASYLLLPSLVLEYGITVIIGGVVAPTGGLVLIGIGVLLKELRRLGARLAAPLAATATGRDDEPQAAVALQAAAEAMPEQQGDLFSPRGVALAGTSLAEPPLAGAAIGAAASRVSPFDKIERALEDVLETTRGEARHGGELADPVDVPGAPAADSTAPDIGRDGDDAVAASDEGRAFFTSENRSSAREPGASTPMADQQAPPASSDEGIVRVYTIGESSFTMYADGIIRARTPEGDLTFETMDDLKSYLEKSPVTITAKA